MKLAISVPEATFLKVDQIARQLGTSRSAIFAKAVDAYRVDAKDDDLTEAANRYADAMTNEMRDEQAAWLHSGAQTVLRHTEW